MRTTFEKAANDEGSPIVKRVMVPPFLAFIALALSVFACGGSSASPTTPTTAPSPAATRVIGLTGSLTFGNVAIGQVATSTITITNRGNAALTITGMTAPGSVYTASSTTGTIGAGGSLPVTILFRPTAVQSYSGTLTVNGDQTGGTNTLPISGTGTTAATTTPPATFAVNGTVTDGTSHGLLPNITVQIASGTNAGKSAVTDGSGNYVFSGLAAGTFTLSAAATSYQTTTQQVTLSASTRVDLVLQRTITTTPTPPANNQCPRPPYRITIDPDGRRHCRESNGQFALNACCGI